MVKVKPEVNTVTFKNDEPVKVDDSKVNRFLSFIDGFKIAIQGTRHSLVSGRKK